MSTERRGAALEISNLWIWKRSIARSTEKHVRPRLPLGVAQSQRVKRAPTPEASRLSGRYTWQRMLGVDVRASCNAECNASPIWAMVALSLISSEFSH
jgi:hypothetical protein